MKKILLAVLLAGSSIGMFAQTTPTATPTPSQTSPANLATTNGSVTNSTSDPMNTINSKSATNNGAVNPISSSWNNGAHTQTNAAMATSGTLATGQSTLNDHPDQDTTGHPMGKKMKSKKHNDDGTVTKTVTKPNGSTKVKTKHKSSMRKDSTSNTQQ